MKENTTCKTYFAIHGKFDLDEITKIMNLDYTSGHKIGEDKKYGGGVYDWASWEYGTENEETLLANEQLNKIIDVLTPKIEQLQYILKKYDCSFIIEQIPIVNEGNTPALGYDKKVIDFCYHTNTKIDIDLYVNAWKMELK